MSDQCTQVIFFYREKLFIEIFLSAKTDFSSQTVYQSMKSYLFLLERIHSLLDCLLELFLKHVFSWDSSLARNIWS